MLSSFNLERRGRLILFAVLLAVIAAARWHTYDEPLERDLAIYTVIGKEMLKGRALYSDLWDHKPPGVYLTYAAANAIMPDPRAALYLLNVAAGFITMLGIARLTQRFKPDWIWIWAVIAWVIVGGAHAVQANQPNVEAFLNAGTVWFLVWCTALPVNQSSGAEPSESEKTSRWARILSPVMLAVTSLFKQVTVILGLYLAIAFAWTVPEDKRRPVLREWMRTAVFGLIFWIVVAAVFVFNGNFDEFYQAVFEYNSEYSGSLFDNLIASLRHDHLWPGFLNFLWPLAVLSGFGLVAGRFKPETRRFSTVLLALCMATYVQVAMPGKFFPHYFQLWLPVVVICGAWALTTIRHQKAALVVALLVLYVPLRSEIEAFQLPAEQWSRNKYGDEFVIDKLMANDIRNILQPGETFYHWGNQASLYFETGISPPAGVFFSLMIWSELVGEAMATRILHDLQLRLPDLYVEQADWGFPINGACGDLRNFIHRNYRPIDQERRYGKFLLYARNGTALDQRLQTAR